MQPARPAPAMSAYNSIQQPNRTGRIPANSLCICKFTIYVSSAWQD